MGKLIIVIVLVFYYRNVIMKQLEGRRRMFEYNYKKKIKDMIYKKKRKIIEYMYNKRNYNEYDFVDEKLKHERKIINAINERKQQRIDEICDKIMGGYYDY